MVFWIQLYAPMGSKKIITGRRDYLAIAFSAERLWLPLTDLCVIVLYQKGTAETEEQGTPGAGVPEATFPSRPHVTDL